MEESETTQPQSTTPTDQAALDRRIQLMIVGGGILILAALILAIVLMATHAEATVVVRDIAIVFVAVETLFIGIAMIFLMLQIQLLIKVLREEIQPLLKSVNETASTVRGTTVFVSENLVSPIIKAAGFSAAVRQVATNLFAVAKGAMPHKSAHVSPEPVQVKGGLQDVTEE